MSRFTIGQKLVGVSALVTVPGRNGNPPHRYTRMGIPFLFDLKERGAQVTRFLFKEFEVMEHHKVRWTYDEPGNEKHDGFILRSEDGVTYNNQYPTADYGQLSTTCDYVFEHACASLTKEEITKLVQDPVNPTQWMDMSQFMAQLDPKVNQADIQLINDHKQCNVSMASVAYITEMRQRLINEFHAWAKGRYVVFLDKRELKGINPSDEVYKYTVMDYRAVEETVAYALQA